MAHQPQTSRSFEQFEEAKRVMIEEIQKLHYENDPHFMLVHGDHTHHKLIQYSCSNWNLNVGMDLVESSFNHEDNEAQ